MQPEVVKVGRDSLGAGMKVVGWSGVVVALAWTAAGWAQPADAPPPAAPSKHVAIIIKPDWLVKPTIDQMMAVYPSAANGASGKATIRCWVQTSGLLRSCDVWAESPKGMGFGGAALLLAPTFLMKPATKDGTPVEAEVTIPIAFESAGPFSGLGPTVTVLGTPIWARTPSVAEILAEIDKKVGDKFADGKVALQCSVAKKTGLLSDCLLVNASPGMAEFRGVARPLTSKFQIAPESLADKKNDVKVNLTFSFPDMTSAVWSGRYLSRTHWTRVPSADPNRKTFPDEAAKAGLKEGMATVDCVIAADGGLTQCKTVSESTPGVGFGPVAEQIAQVFATNPWTEDGLPAEGAHVQLPIKMVDADADKPAPGAAPTPATKP